MVTSFNPVLDLCKSLQIITWSMFNQNWGLMENSFLKILKVGNLFSSVTVSKPRTKRGIQPSSKILQSNRQKYLSPGDRLCKSWQPFRGHQAKLQLFPPLNVSPVSSDPNASHCWELVMTITSYRVCILCPKFCTKSLTWINSVDPLCPAWPFEDEENLSPIKLSNLADISLLPSGTAGLQTSTAGSESLRSNDQMLVCLEGG